MTPRARGRLIGLLVVALSATAGGCVREPPRLAPKTAEPLRLPPALADERVVEGAKQNVPPGHPDSSFASNCADQPCRGYCVLNTRTQVTSCRCYDRQGGCPEGLICCKAKASCAAPEECFRARKTP